MRYCPTLCAIKIRGAKTGGGGERTTPVTTACPEAAIYPPTQRTKNMKIALELWDRPKMFFWPKLGFAGCVWYFDRACYGVCIPSWRIQVGDFPADVRVNRTTTFKALFCAGKLYNPRWGGQNQTCVDFSMHRSNNCCILYTHFGPTPYAILLEI